MGSLRKTSRRGKGTGRKATGRKGTRGTGRKGTRGKGTRGRKVGRKGTGRKGTRHKGRKYRQRGGFLITLEQKKAIENPPMSQVTKQGKEMTTPEEKIRAAKERIIEYFEAIGGLKAYKEILQHHKIDLSVATEKYFHHLLDAYDLLGEDIQINYEDFKERDAIKGVDKVEFNEIIKELWDNSGNGGYTEPKETRDGPKNRPNSINKFFFEHKDSQPALNNVQDS